MRTKDRDNPFDDLRIKLAALSFDQLRENTTLALCLLVTAAAGHGIVGVQNCDNTSADRNFIAAQPVGVSMSVVSFVVMTDHLRYFRKAFNLFQDVPALNWVCV